MGGGMPENAEPDVLFSANGEYWTECPKPGCLFVSMKVVSSEIALSELDDHECYFTMPEK